MTLRSSNAQQGFGVVGMLVLLPFLISVLSLIAGSVLLLKTDARLKHDCRTSVLNSQREVAGRLRELIALNRPAKALRLERKLAENELRLAILASNPPAIAMARAHLLSVQLRQKALMIRQKALVVIAKGKSIAAPARAKAAVLGGLEKESRDNGGLRTSMRGGVFEVVTEPKGDTTPDYHPSPKFTAKQTVDLNVELELGPLLPEWLRKLLPTKGLKLNTHCQGTIERQENEWIETLNAVK